MMQASREYQAHLPLLINGVVASLLLLIPSLLVAVEVSQGRGALQLCPLCLQILCSGACDSARSSIMFKFV